jgi:glycosidase
MRFTTNHDENSWNGTEYSRLGEGARTFAVLFFTFPGIPLIYSGQESAMNKSLRFFDKDTINWGKFPLQEFYTTLCALKKSNKALLNGNAGGALVKVSNDQEKSVYSFTREKNGNKILVILNLTAKPCTVRFPDGIPGKKWVAVFGNVRLPEGKKQELRLNPWQYLVYQKR